MKREEAKMNLEKICSVGISDELFERESILLEEFIDKIYNGFGKELENYNELLYAVHSKFENESRHETALRYITEHENQTNSPLKQIDDKSHVMALKENF